MMHFKIWQPLLPTGITSRPPSASCCPRGAGIAGAPPSGRDLAAREAALAEALKALAALSGFEPAPTPKPDEPLRDALTRLQGLRGAA